MKLGVMAMLVGAGLTLGSLTGCETLSQTAGENMNTVNHSMAIDLHQVPEDWEYLWLVDRGSWLSRKPIPQN